MLIWTLLELLRLCGAQKTPSPQAQLPWSNTQRSSWKSFSRAPTQSPGPLPPLPPLPPATASGK